MIRFAFTNSYLIELLQKRGKAIQNRNENELNKYNKSIQKIIEDEKQVKNIRQPCTAFITFKYI